MNKLVAFMILSVMTFAYMPDSAPIVTPEESDFTFDPNDYPYDVMFTRKMLVGSTYNGIISVGEPDGDNVNIVASGLTLSAPTSFPDANDPDGIAIQYNYPYQYVSNDIGITDILVTVTDPNGLNDNRVMLFYGYENQPPVIHGCQ